MKNLFSILAVSLTLLTFLNGCLVYTPRNVADVNAPGLPEPISYYSGIQLFDLRQVPLVVAVNSSPADELSLAATLKELLQQPDVQCVSFGRPCDLQISVKSDFEQLTPAPNCRLSHTLTLSVATANGAQLVPYYDHKTDSLDSYATAAEAKAKMLPQINKSLKVWERNHFRTAAGTPLKAALLRFRTHMPFIEVDPLNFEEDLRKILNKLRQLPGVADVRLIESNKNDKLASFRVLYRSHIVLLDEIKKQK